MVARLVILCSPRWVVSLKLQRERCSCTTGPSSGHPSATDPPLAVPPSNNNRVLGFKEMGHQPLGRIRSGEGALYRMFFAISTIRTRYFLASIPYFIYFFRKWISSLPMANYFALVFLDRYFLYFFLFALFKLFFPSFLFFSPSRKKLIGSLSISKKSCERSTEGIGYRSTL